MASWSVRFRGFISVPCASCKMEVHPSHPKLDNFRFETYGFGMFWWSPILRNTHLMMNLRWGTHSIAMAQNDLPLNSDRPASSTALRIQYSHSPSFSHSKIPILGIQSLSLEGFWTPKIYDSHVKRRWNLPYWIQPGSFQTYEENVRQFFHVWVAPWPKGALAEMGRKLGFMDELPKPGGSTMEVSNSWGYLQFSSICRWIFHEINHPGPSILEYPHDYGNPPIHAAASMCSRGVKLWSGKALSKESFAL